MVMTPARSVHHYDTYTPPPQGEGIWLRDLVQASKRSGEPKDIRLFFVGDLALVSRRCVSIIGTREASPHGLARATRLARELVQHGTVIVSGLARGIDTAAHLSAIGNGGRTVAIIGTPLSKASPVENASLQETIWRHHLLISLFPKIGPSPRRTFLSETRSWRPCPTPPSLSRPRIPPVPCTKPPNAGVLGAGCSSCGRS